MLFRPLSETSVHRLSTWTKLPRVWWNITSCVLIWVNRDLLFLWSLSLGFLNIPEIFWASLKNDSSSDEPSCQIFRVHQSVNRCCVQCDCCGSFSMVVETNKVHLVVFLCTCGFPVNSNEYTMMKFCLCTFGYFWLGTRWLMSVSKDVFSFYADFYIFTKWHILGLLSQGAICFWFSGATAVSSGFAPSVQLLLLSVHFPQEASCRNYPSIFFFLNELVNVISIWKIYTKPTKAKICFICNAHYVILSN